MNRRRFIQLAGSAGAGMTGGLLAYGGFVERRHLVVERSRHPEDTAEGRDGIRVVQLSDLHMSELSSFHEEVARLTQQARPDLIALTGDSVDDPDRLDDFRGFLELLPRDVPLVGIMGNWEYWGGVTAEQVAAALHERGGLLLVDGSVGMRLNGLDVLLTGLDDLVAGRPSVETALTGAGPADLHLVLAHCPAHRDILSSELEPLDREREREGRPALRPSVVLSGHTHGGQVDLFGLHVTPEGSGPYLEGWYRSEAPPLYVSRGIGTSVIPLRIGARPEVTVLELGSPR